MFVGGGGGGGGGGHYYREKTTLNNQHSIASLYNYQRTLNIRNKVKYKLYKGREEGGVFNKERAFIWTNMVVLDSPANVCSTRQILFFHIDIKL